MSPSASISLASFYESQKRMVFGESYVLFFFRVCDTSPAFDTASIFENMLQLEFF